MALPIFIPLLIKGAMVVGKVIAAKGASAAVAKGAVVAVKTVGMNAAIGATVTGLVATGAVVWTYERILMAKRALNHFEEKRYLEAGNEVTRILRSVDMTEAGELGDIGKHWISNGAPIDSPDLPRLISILRQAVDEATTTQRDVNSKL